MAKARPLVDLAVSAPTAHVARVILHERLADMYAFAQYIDHKECIQELHDLRIAVKRVRYSLEMFAMYLPTSPDPWLAELVRLQDELGELHDSEVVLALLRLSLQAVGAPLEQVQETGKQGRKPLLAADLLTRIKSASVPPTVAHLGGFLSRQQMRREQAYQAFRQHWTRLEQEQFHKLFLIYIQE